MEQPAAPERRPRRRLAHGIALLVFAAATAVLYGPVWLEGVARVVPANARLASGEPLPEGLRRLVDADTTWVAWIVARNARTLLREPGSLLEVESCAPASHALTLGDPVVSQAVLALPAELLSGDPVVAHNAALALQRSGHGLAMYALLFAWTGSPVAGLVAGLFYGFHPSWVRDVTHPYVYDTVWIVLCLLFARRLFERWRWRDALALGVCGALQLGVAFYPILAAACVALPFGLWLVLHCDWRRARPARLLAVALPLLGAFLWIQLPYLDSALQSSFDAAPAVDARAGAAFAAAGDWAPGGTLFPGFAMLLLVAASALPGRRATPGVPRWPFALAALLSAAIAVGPFSGWIPGPFELLAGLAPGLERLRAPVRIASGTHLALCVLAGAGCAALLARTPERPAAAARGLASLLVALALAATLGPPLVGRVPGYRALAVRPAPDTLAFYTELRRRRGEGAILELPVSERPLQAALESARRVSLSGYHGLRTSACYGSLRPKGHARRLALARRVAEASARNQLAADGFLTIVLHEGPGAEDERRALEAAARGPGLTPLHRGAGMSAWAIEP